MSETPALLSLNPTENFVEKDGVPLRVWTGTTGTGGAVTALIAGLQMTTGDAAADKLRSIPPPVAAWSTDVRDAMQEIWMLAAQLSGPEAREIADDVRLRASYRDLDSSGRTSGVAQACARCGAAYHGPLIYCSLACHQEDAP